MNGVRWKLTSPLGLALLIGLWGLLAGCAANEAPESATAVAPSSPTLIVFYTDN